MKIFELLNQNSNQSLDPETQNQIDNWWKNGQNPSNPEDDEQGKFDTNKVDQNLQDIAQQTQDGNAQPELPGGAPETPPELDSQNVQPIDDALLQQIKNQAYVTKYDVKDNSPISPLKIAGMQLPDLANLRNMVRFKIQSTMMKHQIGLDDDPAMEYYSDLLRFVNTVMTFKTSDTKSQLAKINPTPAYQTTR